MKQLNKFTLIIVTLILGSSCSEWLNVKPESEVVLEDFWKNESHVNQVLAACYRAFIETDVTNKILVWGELRSDNVTFGESMPDDMAKILNVDISPDNGYNHWGSFYTIINYCNTFLYYAPNVVPLDPNFTEFELHTLEAEVLTLRALAYFYLIRTFKEVPWVDQPSIDDSQDYMVPGSPGEDILDYIVLDLNTALKYARDEFKDTQYNKGRITKNAVRALLADIYLWQQNYSECIQLCDQILEDDKQNLELVKGEDVLKEVFYFGNSTESIFELQYLEENGQYNQTVRDYFGYGGNPFGMWQFPYVLATVSGTSPFNYQVGSNYESKIEANKVWDLRKIDFLFHQNGSDEVHVFKYAGRREANNNGGNTYFYRSTTANWIVYRLSEIYLMKAEALIQLESDNALAIELINETYLRSNPDLMGEKLKLENYDSKAKLEKLLLRERQREFMFEGKRWFDLMRLALRAGETTPLLNYVLKKYSGTSSSYVLKMTVMDALYLPIHSNELKTNTALVQNDFYKLSGEE